MERDIQETVISLEISVNFLSDLVAGLIPAEYIWHKDEFKLQESSCDGLFCWSGSIRFGDCITDEWFVVWILQQITLKIHGIVARVRDNDGEFLLIEAAAHLPKWLDPSTSVNRVFIFDGRIQIIPLPQTHTEIALYPVGNSLSLHLALKVIRSECATEASASVQTAIDQRISGYPLKASDNFHIAKCVVPETIAKILWFRPQLVSPAVEAFYQRDPVGLQACRIMANFPPRKCVMTTVRMTKVLFAQLASQQFVAPNIFTLPSENDPDYKAHELGMKLTCGFEILYDENFEESIDKLPNKLDLESDPIWKIYYTNLQKLGFFKVVLIQEIY
ncbi:hypothetical protein HK096_000771 [Nowakowskiella sp. JEL0078]|nr:hypothetical protein HK096_000771 [Nowakowskiella sp. JEL0078]